MLVLPPPAPRFVRSFKLYSEFGEDEFRHCFLPREGVVDSFVVQNPDTGEITDMCSFYHLPSSIIGHKQHNKLNAAYSFYNVATSVSLLKLMQDCLTLARIVRYCFFSIVGSVLRPAPVAFLTHRLAPLCCPALTPCRLVPPLRAPLLAPLSPPFSPTSTFSLQRDFDVFNALNIMENDKFLKDLKFGIGDGHLQYYLYNWLCPEMGAKDIGLVLL